MRTFLFAVALAMAISASGVAADSESVLEGRTLYRLQVEGLACAFCAYSVERSLQAVAGVEYVDVDLDSGRVLVGVEPGHQLDETKARDVLNSAGFHLKSMEIRPMTRDELKRGGKG